MDREEERERGGEMGNVFLCFLCIFFLLLIPNHFCSCYIHLRRIIIKIVLIGKFVCFSSFLFFV